MALESAGRAEKIDAIIESGGWKLLAEAHAWFDPSEDEEGNDPPRERGAYKLPHHEILDGRLRVVWNGVRSAMQVPDGSPRRREHPRGGPQGGLPAPRAALRGVREGSPGLPLTHVRPDGPVRFVSPKGRR